MQSSCDQTKKVDARAQQDTLKKWAAFIFFYTLLVILWGAWVRISHSGDGCGDTWPLCGGKLIPEAQRGKTWVEYGHRLMSGVYGILIAYFWWKCRKSLNRNLLAYRASLMTFIFTISEALLGAKLVIFGLVTSNDTPFRAFVMALHQINSLLLSGAIAICWVALEAGDSSLKIQNFFKSQTLWILVFAVTGAWASLSTTLFPSESLLSGLMNDFSGDAHYLVRLRILHPLVALSVGGFLIYRLWKNNLDQNNSELVRKVSGQTTLAFLIAIAFGASTLLALSPTWMKLIHLALAHTLWALLIRWTFIYKSSR